MVETPEGLKQFITSAFVCASLGRPVEFELVPEQNIIRVITEPRSIGAKPIDYAACKRLISAVAGGVEQMTGVKLEYADNTNLELKPTVTLKVHSPSFARAIELLDRGNSWEVGRATKKLADASRPGGNFRRH